MLKKDRKISDCKSRRLESKIMKLINKDNDISEICQKLNMSHTTIKKVVIANGIDIDGRIKAGKLRRKTKRNERIYKKLLNGEKYQDIAENMNITKARVEQVAVLYKYSRWEESRKRRQEIVEKLNKDIHSGLSYQKILKKYKPVLNFIRSHSDFPKRLYNYFMNKRNVEIGVKYQSGKKARKIISSDNKIINDPQKVKSLSNIYAICSKQGIYKYPKVGRRIDGGSFEKVSILRLVKDLREVKQFSFEAIANYLNSKNHKTICGKSFNMANARFKYLDALKEGL